MADIVSRAFKNGKFFHAQNNLTTYCNLNFPLPQQKSWRECTIPPALASRVISCLRGELLPMAQLLRLPRIVSNTGLTGPPTQKLAKSTHSSEESLRSNETSSSQVTLRGSGRAITVEEIKLKFRPSRMAFRPSPRPSNWLLNQVPSIKAGLINTQPLFNAS